MITADAGGSNGYRTRAWKADLADLAAETGLQITVCHFPPGTSKWNKIEHRLFCHITMNWRGRPLTSHEVVVQSIAATTTGTGLRVHAQLDTDSYPTGRTVTDTEMTALPLTRHIFHGDWNYTLHPATIPADQTHQDQHPASPETEITALSDPLLTGLNQHQLSELTHHLDDIRSQNDQAKHHDRRQQALATGKKPHLPRSGRPLQLGFPERVLATILHRRLQLPHDVLAVLFHSHRSTIRRAVTEVRQLLDQHGTTITPADLPPAAMTLLRATTNRHYPASEIKPAS